MSLLKSQPITANHYVWLSFIMRNHLAHTTSAVKQVLRKQGIDELYIKVLEDIYMDTTWEPSSSTKRAEKIQSGKALGKATQSPNY